MTADDLSPPSRAARVGLWLGPALGLAVFGLLADSSLSVAGQRLAGVTVLMACWWMTEAVPVAVTALLPLALFPLLGIRSAAETAPAYGHDLIWLFFGGFQLAFALERWHLHRRMAAAIVRRIGTRGDRLVLGFMLAVGVLSMWLMNTSITLMMLPVALAVARGFEGEEGGPFGAALMLGIAYAASVGGMGTYLGTAPNLVFAGVARKFGVDVSFTAWMAFAAPLALLLVLLIWVYLTRLALPVPRRALPPEHPAMASLLAPPAPWTSGAVRVAIIFALAVVAWVSNRWVFAALGFPARFVTDSTIAIAAAVALFLVPAGGGARGAVLDYRDTVRTPWHILLLFGGGFALAGGFDQSGLSAWLGAGLARAVDGLPLGLVILAVVLLVTFLTEVTSNTATATVLLPVIGGLAVAMGVPPVSLMVPATLAASCAFMLPVATPPNAIVYGTGLFGLPVMARVGFAINLGSAVVITVWTLLVGPSTLGG
ncbi:MAG: SLC13/DASS family transporter [Myxococcales bacterium]|nr:SLC13/DASS family transporter [Myxococcales bacterium]MCB9545156.1 SLC13/DASS family transporter [Myxococcales bacterium]